MRSSVEQRDLLTGLEARLRDEFCLPRLFLVPAVGSGMPDDVCEHVNIINVPEDRILSVEDYAYDLAREFSLRLCLFIHTPEEARARFPKYRTSRGGVLAGMERHISIPSRDLAASCGGLWKLAVASDKTWAKRARSEAANEELAVAA